MPTRTLTSWVLRTILFCCISSTSLADEEDAPTRQLSLHYGTSEIGTSQFDVSAMKYSAPWKNELNIRYALTFEHVRGSDSTEGVAQMQFYPLTPPVYFVMGFGVSEAKQTEIVLRVGAGYEYHLVGLWALDGSITVDWRDGSFSEKDRGTYLIGIIKKF